MNTAVEALLSVTPDVQPPSLQWPKHRSPMVAIIEGSTVVTKSCIYPGFNSNYMIVLT